MSENERLPNEISVWAVGVGNLPMTPNPFVIKRASKAMNYIKGLKGFRRFAKATIWNIMPFQDRK